MRTRSGKAEPEVLAEFITKLKTRTSDPELRKLLDELIDDKEARQHYLDNFAERSRLAPEQTLRSAARATTIVGKMLTAVSSDYGSASRYIAWVARLGQIFWALVEVAVPRSLPNLIFRHWIKLLYFFEISLIVGTTLLAEKSTQRFAFTAFGITAAIHCAVAILGDIMQSRNRWLNLIKALLIALLVSLVVLGGATAHALFGGEEIWVRMKQIHDWFAKPGADTLWVRIVIALSFAGFLVLVVREDIKRLWRRKSPR
jgi:hypothetical protein